jgi:HPt (histidine-containing phosphotransfer) domain-containing protein
MAELLDLFLSELPKRVDSVMNAWETRELNTLRRLAHQLKGSCAGYGFPTIGAAAGRVESTASTNAPLDKLGSEVTELVDLCRRAMSPNVRHA